jgi:hypothetical protein
MPLMVRRMQKSHELEGHTAVIYLKSFSMDEDALPNDVDLYSKIVM